MGSRRMISSDMFEDEFYIGLDMFGRNLWVGLIVKCADDQGRLQDNSILIKSQVFPADNIDPQLVENALVLFDSDKRIIRYTAGGKKLIQIPTWWKHQTPQWASKSRYLAPEGWTDREKYHAPGNKIENHNWNHPGGFEVSNPLSNPLSNPPPNGIDDGEGEGNGKGEGESTDPLYPPLPETALYTEVTGLIPDVVTEQKVIEKVRAIRAFHHSPPHDRLIEIMTAKFSLWKSSKTKDGRPYNPSNPDWLDWCVTGYDPTITAPKKVRKLTGANGQVIEVPA